MIQQPAQSAIPPSLLEAFNAANSVEEIKQVIMTAIETGELAVATPISRPKLDFKSTILNLRAESGLEGTRIGRSDAARKYKIGDSTIKGWEKRELEPGVPLVKVYKKGFGRGQQVMVDEGHVAALVALSRLHRTGGQKAGPIPGFYSYGGRRKAG